MMYSAYTGWVWYRIRNIAASWNASLERRDDTRRIQDEETEESWIYHLHAKGPLNVGSPDPVHRLVLPFQHVFYDIA